MMQSKENKKNENQTETTAVKVALSIGQLLEREELKQVKWTHKSGFLHPEYLIELLNFIGVISHRKEKQRSDEIRDRRRDFFDKKDWSSYENEVSADFAH